MKVATSTPTPKPKTARLQEANDGTRTRDIRLGKLKPHKTHIGTRGAEPPK